MRKSSIFAICGLVFGLVGAFFAFFISVFDDSLLLNGGIALISSFLGIFGIFIVEKNYKAGMVQYIISALGLLIGISLYGLIGFILYIIAALFVYSEKDELEKNINNEKGFARLIRKHENKKAWISPIISVILIIAFITVYSTGGSISGFGNSNENIVTLTNVTNDMQTNFGYTHGSLKGSLESSKDLSYVDIRVTWYSSDGTIISEGSDISIHKAVKGQKYAFDLSYYDEKSPSKAEIRVYDGLGEDNCIYNQTVNLT